MSYGAPCERAVGAADTMPLRDMEVPGLIPDIGVVELVPKEARRGRQRGRRKRRREVAASRRERSLVDRDRCFDVIAEAVDSHRQELRELHACGQKSATVAVAATRPAEAEGDGDGWHAATVTAAAPAEMAQAAIFTGDADIVGASVGADGTSGAVAVPEVGQTWADVGGFDSYSTCIVGGDQERADRGELAGGGRKTMGAGEIDTEVPISEVTPRPDPGWQYVGRAGGVLQVCDDGGGSRATTTEAGGGVDDARTGLGDADSGGTSWAAVAEFISKLTGSESRADVAPKDESVGMADELECESMRRRAREFRAHLMIRAQASEASGSAVVGGFSAVAFDSEGGAASDDESKGDGWRAATVTAAAPAGMAGAAIFPGGADSVGASVGADGASGAVAASEVGQTWADACGRLRSG